MSASTLVKKLRLQGGQAALLMNAPQGYLAQLGELPDGVSLERQPVPGVHYDYVQLFVRDSTELAALVPVATAAAGFDALFWLCYPKRTSGVDTDLSRDVLWDKVPGMRPVSQVAIDAVWSAVRFRPVDRVGK